MSESTPATVVSISRGLKERCPRCGEGRLFCRYLKVSAHCQKCGLDLARYPADDGPAYLTILLIGHLVVAPLLIFPIVWQASPYLTVPIILPALALLTLFALGRVKGGWIGLMYALEVNGRPAPPQAANPVDRT